jgi:hypothetical protein
MLYSQQVNSITNALLYQLSYPGVLIYLNFLSTALRQMCRLCRLSCPFFILCRTESGTATLYMGPAFLYMSPVTCKAPEV